MDEKNLHSKQLTEQEHDFLAKGNITWEKTEADVWAELENKISEKPAGKSVSLIQKTIRWSAAAMLLLLVGLFGIFSTYTKTVRCLPGERVVAELPDGSKVEMNSESTLKYYPLQWKINRKLKFEGEGFFNVQKGKKFSVESVNGLTEVLGTSFNIYARDDKYRVTCLTGKVQVSSLQNQIAVLTPNMHVELEKDKLVVKKMFEINQAVSWKNNEFYFEGRPLKEVFDEIERQYAVTIRLDSNLNSRKFGSNFSKQYNVEQVLDFVCKTMNLKLEKQSEGVFLVKKKS